MTRLLSFPAFTLLLAAAGLAGCGSSGSPTGSESVAPPVTGTGPELPLTGFYVGLGSNDRFSFEQYFIVQAGHKWEFVEYDFKDPGRTLCQVKRRRGIYSATDSTLGLTVQAFGDSAGACGMTKADFDAYPFRSAGAGETATYKVRSVSASGFDGEDFFTKPPQGDAQNLFIGTQKGSWHFDQKPDPFGFF